MPKHSLHAFRVWPRADIVVNLLDATVVASAAQVPMLLISLGFESRLLISSCFKMFGPVLSCVCS